MTFVEPGRQFAKDSIRLVKRCTKPDRKGKTFEAQFHEKDVLINACYCLLL